MGIHRGTGYEDLNIESGLIQIYILHRAAIEPTSAVGLVEQLKRHEFNLTVNSISRILRRMEAKGYVAPIVGRNRAGPSKAYRATRRGRLAIEQASARIRLLQ